MAILWNILRVAIAATTIVAAAELAKRYPRYGGLLLSLPIVSILAFIMGWFQHRDLPAISALAKETVVLVLLGVPFFIPLIFAARLGIGFWSAMLLGVVLASILISLWFAFAPTT
jgi:hypothetical protein